MRYTSRTTPHVTYVTRQVGPRARILYAVQGRISDTLFSGKTTQAAWRSKPSWYAISTKTGRSRRAGALHGRSDEGQDDRG